MADNKTNWQRSLNCNSLGMLIILLSIAMTSTIQAKDYYNFQQMKITAPFNISQDPISGNFLPNYGNELILIGEKDSQPQLALYAFIDEEVQYQIVGQIDLPRELFSFDISPVNSTELQKVLFLSRDSVWQLVIEEELSLSKLVSVESIYLQHHADYFQPYDFILDANGDGLMDIMLAGFDAVNIYLNQGDEKFIHQAMAVKPDVELFKDRVTYTKQDVYLADMNFDLKDDFIALGEGELLVYLQQEDSTFSSEPVALELNENISAFRWWKARGADGKNLDQSNLQHRTLRHIVDINNDDLPDLLVQFAQSSGVLEKRNDYEIYLGKVTEPSPTESGTAAQGNTLISYDSEPNSLLKADGTLMDLSFIDLNEQQKNVILTSTFDISLSQIISALIAGSVDQNILLFTLNGQGKYQQRISKEVELTFSLSTGKRGSPVVIMTDMNGDGNKELILSADENKLKIYPGLNSQKLVSNDPQTVKLSLPTDGRLISSHDINDDGRFELLIRYSSEDKDYKQSELLVFKLD